MDYSTFAQANPGTDYPAKDAALRAQLSLDSDKVDASQLGYQFGYKRNTTAALNIGYYGGILAVDGVLTTIADGTVALSDATTNYVERTAAGVVSKNTVAFSANKLPMFEAVTAGGAVTVVTDRRPSGTVPIGMLSKAVAGGAGTTVLTDAEVRPAIIEFTGALTGARTIEFPAIKRDWIIFNNTTGAFTLTVKVTGQTGVAITQAKRRSVYCDGVDVRNTQDDAAGQAASQAEMEGGSSLAVAVTPGRQHYHPSAAKAWVEFNGTGALVVNASYGVSSVTDNAAGDYTVNFTTAFSTVYYGRAFSLGTSGNAGRFMLTGAIAVGTFQLRISNLADSTNVDSSEVSACFFGDQ